MLKPSQIRGNSGPVLVHKRSCVVLKLKIGSGCSEMVQATHWDTVLFNMAAWETANALEEMREELKKSKNTNRNKASLKDVLRNTMFTAWW